MRRATLYLVLLVACSLGSCTLATEMEVFNNTSSTVRLVVNGDVSRLKPGKDTTIYEREFGQINVETDGTSWTYDIPSRIPESFIAWRGWGFWSSRVASVQIEADGKIWLLGIDQSAPVTDFLDQPEGFPVDPKKQ